MSRFFNKDHVKLRAYVPGEQPQDGKYIKLNTNESPYQPAPKVLDAINRAQGERLNLYPDTEARALLGALADFYNVPRGWVIPGNGSDEILSFIFLAFADAARGVMYPEISYGFYEVYADLYNVKSVKIALNEDLTINPRDYYAAGRTVIIANPNAPTGIALARAEIEGIIRENPDNIVAIDEAYVDFGGESCVELTEKYDNLVVVQTYSKSRSLAGARLGYAIARPDLIADMNRIRFSLNPYNINRLTQSAGAAALSENDYYARKCADIVATREWAKAEYERRGFAVTKSRTNFLFVSSEKISGADYYERLKRKGALIRHFTMPKIVNWNRVTVGSPEQMRRLFELTDEILEEII